MASIQSIVKVETTISPVPGNKTYNIKVFLANSLASGQQINYYKSSSNLESPTQTSHTTSGAGNIVEIQVSESEGGLPGVGAQVSLQVEDIGETDYTFVVYEKFSNATLNIKSTTQIEIVVDFESTQFTGTQTTVKDQGGKEIGKGNINGNQGVISLTQALQYVPRDHYTFELSATESNGISVGPPVTVNVPFNLNEIPQIVDKEVIAFNGKDITITLSNNANGVNVSANIDVNGVSVTPVLIQGGEGNQIKISPDTADLNMLKPHNNSTVSLLYSWKVPLKENGGVITFNGIYTTPVDLITSVPEILSAHASESYIYIKGSFPKSKTFTDNLVVSVYQTGSDTAIPNLGKPIVFEDYFLVSLPSATTLSTTTTYTLKVQATQGGVSNGPESASIDLNLSTPIIKKATTNGKTVTVEWQGVTEKVQEYEIQLSGSGENAQVIQVSDNGSINSNTFTPSTAISDDDTLSVEVRAVFDPPLGVGYYSSSKSVTLINNYFLSSSSPAVFTASSLAEVKSVSGGTENSAISLLLPNGNYLQSGKNFASSSVAPFSIAANTEDGSQYEITIASSIWKGLSSNKIRTTDVQTPYLAFLEKLETTSFFNAWGIYKVQEAIARYMPQNYAEILYYNYGLDITTKSIDIRPGTILRIIPSNFMVVPGTSRGLNTYDYLDGYVNNAPLDYDVNTFKDATGTYLLGFDAFLTELVKEDVLEVRGTQATSGNVSGMASGADLYASTFKNPFYKLFFPTNLLSPTGAGSTNPSDQFNISSATSIKNMQDVTSGALTNFYFRGRSLVKICIKVVVNGNEKVVPVGTTVSNILDGYAAGSTNSTSNISGLQLKRALGQARLTSDASDDYEVGKLYEVIFDLGGLPSYTGLSPLDMPLLHGDRLTINI